MHTTEQVLEETEAALQVAHMAKMIARLACELKKVSPHHPLPVVAGQYLDRHALHHPHPEPETDDCALDAGAGYADEYDGPERRKTPATTQPDDAYTLGIKAIA
jgi:hypothetical protein